MRHVAFIECNTSGSGFRTMETARRLGYRVTLVTRDRGHYRTPGQPLSHLLDGCDHVLTAETNDPAELAAALAAHRDRHGLDGIVCASEYHQHTAAVAARALGLPGPDPDAVARARNTAATRQALDEAGLPNPRYAVVDTVLGALAAAADIGYPCVLKPVDRSSSANMRLVAGPGELAEHYELMTRHTRHSRGWRLAREVVVEQYQHGPEFSVQAVACRGEISVLGCTSKGLVGQGTFAAAERIFPAPALLPWQRRYIESAAVAALRALGLDHGVCHTDVTLTGQGPRIVEVNAWVGGMGIPEIARLATGFDLSIAAVELAVGQRPAVPTASPERAAGARFFAAPHAGTLTAVRGLEDAAAAAGVVEAGRTAEPGQWVQPPRSTNDFLAYVVAVGSRPLEVAARLDAVAAGIEVDVAADTAGTFGAAGRLAAA